MTIEGTYNIAAPQETVWQHLMSPESLARALPGCERLEPAPDGSFQAVLKIGIGAVKGTYHGRIELADVIPPESYRMKVEGKGAGGFVKGEGTLNLSENGQGGTTIQYSGEAQVGGLIASVGQRLVQATARQVVNQFFQALVHQM
ncbi:MAG TPA: carbon monoxide dehydrogenase subunit G [Terriglobia bacterium]|nr:carbon monoxide dehydrogenase subunit G [Terriglobia bacterium]